MNKQDDQRNPLKNFAIFSGIAIQMGVTIFLFAWLGRWLDDTYNEGNKLYLIILTLFGVFISIYVVIKQLNQMQK
ncbi:AtpZ/AtpI family protein [Robertkochia marina]|uniref:AtpZ/AtpI family protein n=1 Tax=Robertkochia marina TaxID=1227945 RepID=A0A4S3M2J7_9FLAO|nr:AtpZ/AtpI family protein [Robertkochia marina]THD69352.1 AtpZ/AtpI family protein [Robertkochia marina]TRZ47387.1 AtpZ/AtpI family protein [Robertkochia marina]